MRRRVEMKVDLRTETAVDPAALHRIAGQRLSIAGRHERAQPPEGIDHAGNPLSMMRDSLLARR